MHGREWAPVMRILFPRKAALTDRGPAALLLSSGFRRLQGGTSTTDWPEKGFRLSSATFIRSMPLAVPCAALQ